MPEKMPGPASFNGNDRPIKELFSNPYSVNDSFQLSGKTIGSERLSLISYIEELDQALLSGSLYRFRKCFQRITRPILSSRDRRKILLRIIYNHLYLIPVTPIEFQETPAHVPDLFNLGPSREVEHSQLSIALGHPTQSLLIESRRRFTEVYGPDLVKTTQAIRCARREDGPAIQEDGDTTIALATELASFRKLNSNYLHLDEKKGITTILYLSQTYEEHGAFRYVVGSEQMRYSATLKALHEYVYQDLNFRDFEKMSSLPPEYRAGINYYHWLEPEKQDVLDSYVYHVTGPPGRIIKFAGNALLHGGGLPVRGVRTALFTQHTGKVLHRAKTLFNPHHLFNLLRC